MLRKILLTGCAFVAFGLTKFLFGILVIRWAPALLGEINHALSIFLLVPLFFAPGLGMLVTKFASEFRGANETQKAREIFTFSFLAVTLTALICTAFVYLYFGRLKGNMEISAVTQYGLTPMLLLYSLYVFLRTSYYGFDRVSLYLRNEIVSSVMFFVVLGIALGTKTEWLVVLPFAAHSTVFVAMAITDLRHQFRFHELFRGIARDFRRYGHYFLCTMINSLAGPGAFHFGIILTGWLTGEEEIVAYYSVLLYALQPLNLLPTVFMSVLMPTVSHSHGAGDHAKSIKSTNLVFRPLFLAMTLICIGMSILGWEAVYVVTETQIPVLLAAFLMLLFGAYCYLISSPPSVLLNGTQHIGVIAVGGVIALAATITFWYIVVPKYAILGAAGGYMLLEIIKSIWAFGSAYRIFGWRGRLGVEAAGIVLVGAGLAAASLMRSEIVLHLFAGGVFALLFLLVFRREIRDYAGKIAGEFGVYAKRT